ncbi:3D domain-containing protein [Neobacillus cucumis]|uniref:3D domain-containing protein n=1 Tax=Neobacillus cucumis TaxID=1740721 RepID=UPI00203BB610|nr:3D domain-containing protein [Neobacillus cucumis]MCM3727034.1 3D domain-containing protein [Neobacillus cucumis]
MKKSLITISTSLMLLFGISSGASAASNTYTVKKGDSLSKIAKTYHITVNQLKQWNHLSSDLIKINQVLKTANPGNPANPAKPVKAIKEITVNASAYTLNFKNCTGITATGINLKKNPNQKVISVDPKVIKLGSKVYVPGYGYAIAGDTGGAIKGYKIDVFIPSQKAAVQWGRKNVKIQILN